MSKEELINIINNLDITEIKNCLISYINADGVIFNANITKQN